MDFNLFYSTTLKDIFSSIACLCVEGPEVFPSDKLMEAILKEVERGYKLSNLDSQSLIQSIDILQTHLEHGEYLAKQDGKWWLFKSDGEGVVGGNTLRDVLINLILMIC